MHTGISRRLDAEGSTTFFLREPDQCTNPRSNSRSSLHSERGPVLARRGRLEPERHSRRRCCLLGDLESIAQLANLLKFLLTARLLELLRLGGRSWLRLGRRPEDLERGRGFKRRIRTGLSAYRACAQFGLPAQPAASVVRNEDCPRHYLVPNLTSDSCAPECCGHWAQGAS